jgi:hypothetical protein
MKRRLILLAVGVSVACALAVGVSTQARAGGNGAAVIRDGGQCRTNDNNGNAWLFSCNFQIVFTPNGSVTQHLNGSVIPGVDSSPLPSKAVTDVTGGPCLVFDGQVITTVVAGVVTPSGKVQLTCKS